MDRRSLLKLIGLAPVAAPVMAQAALAPGAAAWSPLLYGEAVLGETLSFEPLKPLRQYGPAEWSPDVLAQVRPGFSQSDTIIQDEDFSAEFARWMPDGLVRA